MGHVHLKVSSIADIVSFYRDVPGFELMAQLGAQATFLAADTTTISARTRGRAPELRRHPPEPPPSGT